MSQALSASFSLVLRGMREIAGVVERRNATEGVAKKAAAGVAIAARARKTTEVRYILLSF